MKIGQAIDEIVNNCNKEFRNEELIMYWDYYSKQITIKNREKKGELFKTLLTKDHIDRDWELVQKPVTFMEAVESGKEIRPEIWREYTEMELDDFLYDICGNSNEHIRELLLGKFYIKEDN